MVTLIKIRGIGIDKTKELQYYITLYPFQAPVAMSRWEGTRDASVNGPKCIQKDPSSSSDIEGSEDCLHLNVFTKIVSKRFYLIFVE